MDGSWQEEVRKKRIDTLFSLLYFSLECQPICHNPISPDISMLKMINTITICCVKSDITQRQNHRHQQWWRHLLCGSVNYSHLFPFSDCAAIYQGFNWRLTPIDLILISWVTLHRYLISTEISVMDGSDCGDVLTIKQCS